jgi:hypothetical protein
VNLAERKRVHRAIGTVAHNRPFTLRELREHVGIPCRDYVKQLVRYGMLEIVDVAPVRYFPTHAMWPLIEADSKED